MLGVRSAIRAARRAAMDALRQAGLEPTQRDPGGYRVPSEFLRRSYLSEVGWFRSVEEQSIVDAAGNPLPWLTYPAIKLLADRLPPLPFTVFEFGAGASTQWWAQRAQSIISIEHDANWYESLRNTLPENAELWHIPLSAPDEYDTAIQSTQRKFDVVVIDGRRRVECSRYVEPHLSDRGVVIWDNSDRPRYSAGIAAFQALNFRLLELHGMAPRDNISSTTGILYRNGNLLGL